MPENERQTVQMTKTWSGFEPEIPPDFRGTTNLLEDGTYELVPEEDPDEGE